MVAELEILSEWIPEQMQPGTIFVLENAVHIGEREDPYWAVLSCPNCGTLGLITRKQIAGLIAVICGSGKCSAQFLFATAKSRYENHSKRADLFGTWGGTVGTITGSSPLYLLQRHRHVLYHFNVKS